VLTEISRDSKLGIDIFQENIPIEGQVAGACELLGLDPLYVANEGIFISVVNGEVADKYLQKLGRFEGCTNASIIGEIVKEHKGQVVLTSSIGGKRVVNMLVGEQLPRIC
jgi:hydrogenase expression/formation protein HypE